MSLYLIIKNNYQQRELWTGHCTAILITVGFCWDVVMMKFCKVLALFVYFQIELLVIFREAPGNAISDICYLDKIINNLFPPRSYLRF